MHDKNSIPVTEFSNAKLDMFLSKVAAPTSIFSSSIKLQKENFELNLMVMPFMPPSLIKVLEPAPIVLICKLRFLIFFKKVVN